MVTSARQPGSSFKPIYYSAALADGDITAASQWKDELTDFGGGYVPYNADRQWHGTVTTRSAIAMSLNIPSVKIMQQYGIEKSITAAKNLGITTLSSSNNYGLSLALGSAEVPLIQMTNAYAAFANQGQQFSPTYITSVKDKFDKEIFHSTPSSKQAINKEGAYLISSILSDNNARAPIFGSSLTIAGHTAAVKTGTTNDDRDAWTIGYTPDMVMGVWVGNNDNTAMANGSVVMAGPIWRNSMTKLLSGTKNSEFTRPSSIVDRAVCKSNGGLAPRATSATYNEVFMAGALPTNTCTAEVVKISVCNLDTNKVEQIDETTFDAAKYSKDTSQCQATVCDTSSGQVVTIDKATYSGSTSQYSTDTTNCKKQDNTPVTVCDTSTTPATKVTITQSQYDQSKSRYTTDLTKCTSATN
jgi:membrane carboxypeptidase/penicillin-binding protein